MVSRFRGMPGASRPSGRRSGACVRTCLPHHPLAYEFGRKSPHTPPKPRTAAARRPRNGRRGACACCVCVCEFVCVSVYFCICGHHCAVCLKSGVLLLCAALHTTAPTATAADSCACRAPPAAGSVVDVSTAQHSALAVRSTVPTDAHCTALPHLPLHAAACQRRRRGLGLFFPFCLAASSCCM